MSIETSNQLIDRAAIATDQAAAQAIGAAQRGVAAVRDGSHRALDRAVQASDSTVGYIRDEPVKAMLIAAATGAALMALLGLFTRSRDRG
ncbi:conserved hypothetical protein [Rubrivivax sp. A210]|uniref:hypothetical protein n=1 Tax=Rubrivivax sp. A210 TaxID=2772301 RepID=UPI00191A9A2C|nr:hypothetical protein [Rubrivivax sp. A210]CAD5365906.1 conserved hypothetical protein [Rubrivivax sp. A210]